MENYCRNEVVPLINMLTFILNKETILNVHDYYISIVKINVMTYHVSYKWRKSDVPENIIFMAVKKHLKLFLSNNALS